MQIDFSYITPGADNIFFESCLQLSSPLVSLFNYNEMRVFCFLLVNIVQVFSYY